MVNPENSLLYKDILAIYSVFHRFSCLWWFDFKLEPIFDTDPAASKNNACHKIGQNGLRYCLGVNFTNILRATFLYESYAQSFFVLEVKVKLFICVRKLAQLRS
jgi:hypothetical protein